MWKFKVPYQTTYDSSMYLDIVASNKKEAREKALYILSTDSDVVHIASEEYILDMGMYNKDNDVSYIK